MCPNETNRDGNSPAAPPRPFTMPRGKHIIPFAPLSAPKSNRRRKSEPKSNQKRWELTYCSPTPVRDAKREHFKHVSILAPLSAPKSNRRGESVPTPDLTKRNGMGTHWLLPRARSRCQRENMSAL